MAVSKALVQLPTKPHALYRFFDRTDVLLYVGITMDLPARVGQHRKDKPWWVEVNHITIEHFEDRAEVLLAEREAIRTEKPLYNSTHNELVDEPDRTPQVVCWTKHGLKVQEITQAWLIEHWSRIPESVRDVIEVPLYNQGRTELAESVMEGFTAAQREIFHVMGRRRGEADGEDELDGPEAHVRALRAAVSHMETTVALLDRGAQMLIDQLPWEAQLAIYSQSEYEPGGEDATELTDERVVAYDAERISLHMAQQFVREMPADVRDHVAAEIRAAVPGADEEYMVREVARRSRTGPGPFEQDNETGDEDN